MQSRNDNGDAPLACDFTVMDAEQRERYLALRRQLSRDLHEARELETVTPSGTRRKRRC